MPVERQISGARREGAGLNPVHPGVFRHTLEIPGEIRPMPATVPRELHVAVIRTDPDESGTERRLADRIDRGMRLGRRIGDGDAAGLLLLLLLRIICRE